MKAELDEIQKVRLGTQELENVLRFKYLGVMQSSDEDPLVPVNHRVAIS